MECQTIKRYYICKACGKLTTSEKISEDAEEYGIFPGCHCMFSLAIWDSGLQEFRSSETRIINQWFEIPKKVFTGLCKENNTAIRLKMLETVSDHYINKI